MLRPMKLEGALKLYMALYFLALALTFFTSIPMLMHVGPKQECLLFAPPPPIKYGSPGGCVVVGVLPLIIAVCALGLIFVHWLQLRKLKAHIELPEMTSDEFRAGFKKTFWKMIMVHGAVAAAAATVACLLTSGYATSCHNLYLEIEKTVRARIDHTPQQNRGQQKAAHEIFADDHTLTRYTVDKQDFLGRNKYEEAITCRAIFTDEKLHFDLKQNHGRDPYTAQYYGFWNNINNDLADVGNFRHIAYRDNLFLELALAGSWTGLLVWVIMLLLMLKERHHLKAFITDESMWGGSNYGEGSVRSGRSRKSSANRLMSPIDFENMDKMSQYSRTSRASRSSRGTSYKDMGRKKSSTAGSTSYKAMAAPGGGRPSTGGSINAPPSQLTISRLEQVPQVDTGYTVKRLLNDNPHLHHHNKDDSHAPHTRMDTSSVANMSIMTVTGAVIGPGINRVSRNGHMGGSPAGSGRQSAKQSGLLDYFGGAPTRTASEPKVTEKHHTSESDIM